MNVKTFIDRPILAGVISVIVLLVGLINYRNLSDCLNYFIFHPRLPPPL